MQLEKINIGSIWTMIVGTAVAITWMFTHFVTSDEFQEYVTEEYYEKYYLVLDRVRRANERGNEELAIEMERTLERIRTKICKEDPEWERCKDDDQ